MRFGGITRPAVVALALSATLAACSSSPEVLEPDPSATSAAPTANAPTMPAQAQENTPEGAAAFVQHYIDVFNYAASTGDVKKLSSLSSPDCDGCQSYISLYRDTYQAGGYFKDSDWKLGELDLEFGNDEVFVNAHVRAPAGRYKESKSAIEKRGNSEDSDIAFATRFSGGDWTMTQIGLGTAE